MAWVYCCFGAMDTMFFHNNLSSVMKFYHIDHWHKIDVMIDLQILAIPISKQQAPRYQKWTCWCHINRPICCWLSLKLPNLQDISVKG